MVTEQNKMNLRRTSFLVTVALAGAALTGCQGSQYCEAESEVFNHFDEWSRKIPAGMVPAPAEKSSGGAVYAYHDGPPGPVGSGSKRVVRCDIGADRRELWITDTPSPQTGQIRFLGFFSHAGEFNFAKNRESAKDNPLVADAMYTLQNATESITYLREKGTSVWRRCRLRGIVWSAFTPEKQRDCLGRAKEVPTEHVQRYSDLGRRFYKTYFFIEPAD